MNGVIIRCTYIESKTGVSFVYLGIQNSLKMDPITLAALAQGGIGLAQMVGGIATKAPDRPKYSPAPAIQQAVNLAEREASAIMPGYGHATQQINQNTANAVNTVAQNASSSSDILNAAGGAQTRANMSMSDLVRMSMQDKARRRGVHLQTLGQLANEQNKAWEYNQRRPFEEAREVRSSLLGGGLQTLTNAGSQYAAIAQMQAGMPQEKTITPLPTAPHSVGYNLSDMVNINQNISWQNLMSRVNGYNQQF